MFINKEEAIDDCLFLLFLYTISSLFLMDYSIVFKLISVYDKGVTGMRGIPDAQIYERSKFMNFKKLLCVLMAVMMVLGTVLTAGAAEPGVQYTDAEGNYSYEPLEQGVYSKGGYTIDKISHPTLGAGEIDGILTGADQDRGNSYSWSMAEAGDYVYIGTCYNSTYYIFHNNLENILKNLKSSGIVDADLDTSKVANDLVEVIFGIDTFDESKMNEWNPVIMSVNKRTGESQVVFCEREIWAEYPEIFPGYSPYLAVKNYLSGYRMAFEFQGKIYFAGMGNPTATLIAIDPVTNTAEIAYYNINMTRGVSNGVHGLLVYDDEILMCLATDNYDGNRTPGGIIVASSDPTAGFDQWRVIADQDDFDGLPAVMQVDGLNGGGIWDIIEYNGYLYVTVVTDKSIDGKINKQGFAMYRGEKDESGDFSWTQVIGDNGTSGYDFGLGIDYSMSCNMWVFDDHLYLGTYNDPMLDLAEIPASGNFELLYNDLDHSIYLYRMDENEQFEQIGGKNDNPYFPDGPIGNLGAGLGNNSNQYVWRYGDHNGELYIGTYDTSTLTYIFTQITDGQVATMEYEDISGRADVLQDALLDVLNAHDNQFLVWFLDKVLLNDYTTGLYQKLSGFASEMAEDKDPVPEYRQMLADYEAFKARVYGLLDLELSAPDFLAKYQAKTGAVLYASAEAAPEGFLDNLKAGIREEVDAIFAALDQMVYDETIHNFVFYFGCNYYAQSCEKGFDLLVSTDGINFDAITRDGFGDESNHGLRTICSTEYGVYMGTANPYNGTQLWRMYSDRDESIHDEPCDGGENCPSSHFVDLDFDAWYHESVDYVVENGLMEGVSSDRFAPMASTTRAMVATIIYRMEGCPAVDGVNPFTDVPEGKWYSDAIAWAAQNGIVKGYTSDKFGINDTVTREQMVTMLCRYAAYRGHDVGMGADLSVFADEASVSNFARSSMEWAVANGLIKGYTEGNVTILNPKGNALSCQVAALMMRLCENVLK